MDRETRKQGIPAGSLRILGPWDADAFRRHLGRLGTEGWRDRFNGAIKPEFVDAYAERCLHGNAMVFGYVSGEEILGAAELHPVGPYRGEVAFSVDREVRGLGLGSLLFERIARASADLGYRSVEVTTHSGNEAMNALARKYGTSLCFSRGEGTGRLDLSRWTRVMAA